MGGIAIVFVKRDIAIVFARLDIAIVFVRGILQSFLLGGI